MSRFGDLLGGKKAAPAPAPEPVVEVAPEPVVEEAKVEEVAPETTEEPVPTGRKKRLRRSRG